MENSLLIGFGNTLRGDDGVGPRLAEEVERWRSPDLRVLVRHALVPELTTDLQGAARVVFADAAANVQEIKVLRLCPGLAQSTLNLGHVSDPEALLALTRSLYHCCPEAWLLQLPAVNFDLGEELSDLAREGMQAGLKWLRGWLNDPAARTSEK